MLKKMLFVLLAALVVAPAAGALFADDNKATHNGEVVGVDREAKTITVKIKVEELGGETKDIQVYQVTGKTVFLDQNDVATNFEAIKAGQRVRIKVQKKEGQRQLLEVEIKPEKKK